MLTLRGEKGPRRGVALEDLAIIEDGSILIRGGEVYQVGPTRRIENLNIARDAIEVNAAGRVVMPGYIDSHTHLAFPGWNSRASDAAARLVRASTVRVLQARCRVSIEAMARHGTTTFETDLGCGLDELSEWKLLRVLRELDGDPLTIVPTLRLRLTDLRLSEDTEAELEESLPRIRRRQMARFAAVEWEMLDVANGAFGRLMHTLHQLSFHRKVHAGAPECAGAIAAALEHRAAGVDHLENIPAADAAVLGNSETIATIAPASEWERSRTTVSARDCIDRGVALALATNFSLGQPGTLSMQMVIALAVSRLKLTVNEAICAATVNGAYALRCGERTGTLEPGKAADLLLLNASDYRDLGHSVGANLVHSTMKNGRFIYREGKVLSDKTDAN